MFRPVPAYPAEADERLRRVVRFVETREGLLRTHLDEWAAYEFGGMLLSRGRRQIWLNNPCPWRHWERLGRHMDWPAVGGIARVSAPSFPPGRADRRRGRAPHCTRTAPADAGCLAARRRSVCSVSGGRI